MKKTIIQFRIALLLAAIVFGLSFDACGNGSDTSGGTAPKITTTSLPDGIEGDAYNETLKATGDTPITWSVSVGELPEGLSLEGNVITGTPTVTGTSNFIVEAANAAGNDTQPLSITIAPAGGGGGTAPTITTASLPNGTAGTAYNQTLTATGDAPITWTTESGALPTGLSLAGTGTISGTPTVAGTSNFIVKAANTAGSNTKTLSITITGDSPTPIEIEIEMVQIQGGTFTMGSPTDEPDRYTDETQHSVTLTGFYMGKYPVTQAQYQVVMGTNPSNFTTPVLPETSTESRPVETVTWYDALEFCNKLSEIEGFTKVYTIVGTTVTPNWNASGYRLPTEAQWEYACRAGTETAYYTGDTLSDDVGWYAVNSGGRTHSVGEKPANQYDLYDMSGNVWEWCWDWYGNYASDPQTDPTGAVFGTQRIRRGGAYSFGTRGLRSAYRNYISPDYGESYIGFRIVRP
jgi:formylglycine-generating enzyme required for sulfatase activity